MDNIPMKSKKKSVKSKIKTPKTDGITSRSKNQVLCLMKEIQASMKQSVLMIHEKCQLR